MGCMPAPKLVGIPIEFEGGGRGRGGRGEEGGIAKISTTANPIHNNVRRESVRSSNKKHKKLSLCKTENN